MLNIVGQIDHKLCHTKIVVTQGYRFRKVLVCHASPKPPTLSLHEKNKMWHNVAQGRNLPQKISKKTGRLLQMTDPMHCSSLFSSRKKC